MNRNFHLAWLCLTACLVGCDPGATPTVSEIESPTRDEFILVELPSGEIKTPTEVKELGTETAEIVLAGKIDAGDVDPFQPGKIAFMLSELPDEGHAADDPNHADDCPFCKKRLANAPKALVQFMEEDQVIAGDPRTSLALEKGDIVYVTGSAQYNEALNTVIVKASGVYRKSGA